MADVKRLNIRHVTRYTYEEPVHYALQQLRLTPRNAHGQTVLDWHVTVTGGAKQAGFDDQFLNATELVKVDPGTTEVEIVSEGTVEIEDITGVIGQHRGYAPIWLFEQQTERTKVGPKLRAIAETMREKRSELDDIALLHQLMENISKTVKYCKGETDSATTAEDALNSGTGVCQDHAHIMISIARELGFPARYISGYLLMPNKIEQDATHAWCEIHVAGLGWVGFDVSNKMSPDSHYVRVAVGRDYPDAAPILGIRQGKGEESLQVSLQVQQ